MGITDTAEAIMNWQELELIIASGKSIIINGKKIEIIGIEEVTIKEEVNNHSNLNLSFSTTESNIINVGEEISIKAVSNSNAVIFRNDLIFSGIIEKVEIRDNIVKLEAKSFSIELDRVKRKRTFQDKEKTYKDIIDAVVKESKYNKFKFIISQNCNKPIEKLIIQYDETDWEFLKRIMSHLGESIIIENGISYDKEIAENNKDKKWAICLGFLDDGKRDLHKPKYLVKGSVNLKEDYLLSSSSAKYEIGHYISHNEKLYIVTKSNIKNDGNVIIYEYTMVSKEKFISNRIKNQNIAGETILAEVVEAGTGENLTRVRVDFIFDKIPESKVPDNTRNAWNKHWFRLSTPYAGEGTGMYFMPEKGDKLLITFMNSEEENSFAGESIRDDNKFIDRNTELVHKRIKISTGQQVMLSKELEKVMLIGNDDRTVYEDVTKDHVRIVADESEGIFQKDVISLQVGESRIVLGPDSIEIKCGSSHIKLDKSGKIEVKGS